MQKIGLEIEAVFPSNTYRSKIVENYPRWECVDDGSLYGDGAFEVRLSRPININELDEVLEEMNEFCVKYDARFSDRHFTGNSDYYDDEDFDCGFHIHFGLPETYDMNNVVSLLKETRKCEDKIVELAQREDCSWCMPTDNHFDSIDDCEHLNNDRYMGVNITNMGSRHKNTIEFRYASAGVVFNIDHLKAYVHYLKDIWYKTMLVKSPKVVSVSYGGSNFCFQCVDNKMSNNRASNVISMLKKCGTQTKINLVRL